MNAETLRTNREITVRVPGGWVMLPLWIALLLGDIALLIWSIYDGVTSVGHPYGWPLAVSLLLLPVCIILLTGLFTLQPNEARVLILFGSYKGTVRESGFHWGNPFYSNGPQQTPAWARLGELQGKGRTGGGAAAGESRKGPGRNKVSLRARTLNGERLKVNDKRGNPVEIAAVVVWRVQDTAQAVFDVDAVRL